MGIKAVISEYLAPLILTPYINQPKRLAKFSRNLINFGGMLKLQ